MIRKMMIVVLVCSLFGCAQHRIVEESFGRDRIYTLNEFRTLREPPDISNSVICLQPGDIVPVKLNLTSEWFGIEPGEVELVAKRKIFFRVALPKNISQERMERLFALNSSKLLEMSRSEKAVLFEGVMLYLSKDAVQWAPLNDKRALKEVFDIQGGTLTAGMGMNETEGMWVALKLETIKK